MTRAPLSRAVGALFAGTLFVSAALMFCVEPMVARLLMPTLGGAPAVWITCMVFFQGALLLGYAYAHAATAWLGVRRQALLHVVVLVTPLLTLPIRVRSQAVGALVHGEQPVAQLLGVLVTMVGLPFFAVGATAPLLQKWFSRVAGRQGADPYHLYVASNLGSLLALAAYPILIEPQLGLSLQVRIWSWGYGLLALAVGALALFVAARGRDDVALAPVDAPTEPLSVGRRLRWLAWSAIPSSLLLGVTTYLTTDVAAIPLFWVVPLALYLTTFILVFARRRLLRQAWMVRLLPGSVAATTLLILVDASVPMSLIMALHVANFFLAAMVCHGELADDRPHAEHLTEFYLWVALGGVLGGLVNGLLAPSVLDRVLEYPAAIVAAAACRRVAGEPRAPRRSDWGFATAVLVVTAASVAAAHALHFDPESRLFGLVFALPLLVTYGQLQRPARFALSILAMMLGGAAFEAAEGRTIHVERGFFGVVRVTRDDAGRFTQIMNGNTIHGRQRRDEGRNEPTSYYTRQGPAGQVFEALHAERGAGRPKAVAVVGLGAGALSTYARPDEPWTFYEINPTVIAVAKDPRYFSFLQDAFGSSPRLTIVVGDARLRLAEAPAAAYDLLVIDAFSSDSIPVHLLTRQAVALYRSRLATDGLLAVHISNRYLDLAPVVGALATDAGLTALVREDTEAGAGAEETGWTPSIWAVMAPPDRLPETLAHDPRWKSLRSNHRPWTDDFSNVLGAIRR